MDEENGVSIGVVVRAMRGRREGSILAIRENDIFLFGHKGIEVGEDRGG